MSDSTEVGKSADPAPSPGLRMGRPFGIPVYLSWTWFLIAAIIVYVFQPQVARLLPALPEALTFVVAFAFAVLLYVSVLLHELAHSVVARMYGLPVRRITLYMLGGFSEIEREPETPGREFMIAFAGPVVSLVLGGLGVLALMVIPPQTVWQLLCLALAGANLIVGAFNLLPGLPLDGGRLLRAGVWKIAGNPISGTVAAAYIGRGIAVLLAAFPVLRALLLGAPFDENLLFMMVWCAILGGFIWMGASQSLRTARIRARMPYVRARSLARRAVPVAADLPLAEALREAQESGAGALVVADPEGRPLALVSETAVKAVPEHRRPWITVGSLSRSLQPELVLSVDLEGEGLIRAMGRLHAEEYLVVDGEDVYGVLTAGDVNRAFAGV